MIKKYFLIFLFFLTLFLLPNVVNTQEKVEKSQPVRRILSPNTEETCIGNQCIATISSGTRFALDKNGVYRNITDVLSASFDGENITFIKDTGEKLVLQPYIITEGKTKKDDTKSSIDDLKAKNSSFDYSYKIDNKLTGYEWASNFSGFDLKSKNDTVTVGYKIIGKIEGIVFIWSDLLNQNVIIRENSTDILLNNFTSLNLDGFLDPFATIKANDTAAKMYMLVASSGSACSNMKMLDVGTENSTQYPLVGNSDDIYATIYKAYDGCYRFNFTLPNYLTIDWINFTLEWKMGNLNPDTRLNTWNVTSSAWNSSMYWGNPPTSDTFSVINITTNPTQFVNETDRTVEFKLNQTGGGSLYFFYVDYAVLDVSYTVDTTPSIYSFNSTNSTIAGTDIIHSLNWTNVGVGSLDSYIFSWSNGANWTFSNTTSDLESNSANKKAPASFNVKVGNLSGDGNDPITFSTAMPDTAYSILLSADTDTDTPYSLTYDNKATTGFDIIAEDASSGAEATVEQWMALSYGDWNFNGNLIKCGSNTTSVGTGYNTITFPSAWDNTNYAIMANSINDDDSPNINYVKNSKGTSTVSVSIEDDSGLYEQTNGFDYCAFTIGEYTIDGVSIKTGNATTSASAGNWQVNFTTPFSNVNYQVVIMAENVSTSQCEPEIVLKNMKNFTFHFEDDGAGTATCVNRPFDWIVIQTGENSMTPAQTDSNSTATTYQDIMNNTALEVIRNITVKVNVSVYNATASTANGNSNPDLWLEAYNGISWIDIGNFSVNNAGNFTANVLDTVTFGMWNKSSDRDLRIKARYLDFISSTSYDEINYTIIIATINSTSLFLNDTAVAFGAGTWSNVTKTVNSTASSLIQWIVYANDTWNNWNKSETFSYLTTSGALSCDMEITPNGTYGINSNASCFNGINGFIACTLLRNGSTTTLNNTLTLHPAGDWDFSCIGDGAVNSTGILIISKGASMVSLYQNYTVWTSDSTIYYPTAININATLNISGVNASIFLNGTKTPDSPINITLLPLGYWNYTGNYTETANYTGSSNIRYINVILPSGTIPYIKVNWLKSKLIIGKNWVCSVR